MDSTLADVLRAGADTLVVRTALYAGGDVARNARALREVMHMPMPGWCGGSSL